MSRKPDQFKKALGDVDRHLAYANNDGCLYIFRVVALVAFLGWLVANLGS